MGKLIEISIPDVENFIVKTGELDQTIEGSLTVNRLNTNILNADLIETDSMWINYMYNDSHIAINAPGTYLSGYEFCVTGIGSYIDGHIEYDGQPHVEFDNMSSITKGLTITNGEAFTYIKLDYSVVPFKMFSNGAMSIDANGPMYINAANDLTISSDGNNVIISAENYIDLNPNNLARYKGYEIATKNDIKRQITIPLYVVSFIGFMEDLINNNASNIAQYSSSILNYLINNNISKEDLYNSNVEFELYDTNLNVNVIFKAISTSYISEQDGYTFVFNFIYPYPMYQGMIGYVENEINFSAISVI